MEKVFVCLHEINNVGFISFILQVISALVSYMQNNIFLFNVLAQADGYRQGDDTRGSANQMSGGGDLGDVSLLQLTMLILCCFQIVLPCVSLSRLIALQI